MKRIDNSFKNFLILSSLLFGFSSQAAELRTEESLQVEFSYNKHTDPSKIGLEIDGHCSAASILGASYCWEENITKTSPIRLSETSFEVPPTTMYAKKDFLTSIALKLILKVKLAKVDNPHKYYHSKFDYLRIFESGIKDRKKKDVTDEARKALSKTVYITTIPEIKFKTSGEIMIQGMRPIQVNENGDKRNVRTSLIIYPVDKIGNKIDSNMYRGIDLWNDEGKSVMNYYSPGEQIITTEKPAGIKYELLQDVTYSNTRKEVLLKSGTINDLDDIDLSEELEGSTFVIRDSI